jgi:hypothetical protein
MEKSIPFGEEMLKPDLYWVERKVFVFLKRWHKNKLPRSFYKVRTEKLVTRWETVTVSNGNYITD